MKSFRKIFFLIELKVLQVVNVDGQTHENIKYVIVPNLYFSLLICKLIVTSKVITRFYVCVCVQKKFALLQFSVYCNSSVYLFCSETNFCLFTLAFLKPGVTYKHKLLTQLSDLHFQFRSRSKFFLTSYCFNKI